jgi:hypothetical protein
MYAPLDNVKEATKTKPKVERPNRIESNQIKSIECTTANNPFLVSSFLSFPSFLYCCFLLWRSPIMH